MNIPENSIYAISYDPIWQNQGSIDSVFESLKGIVNDLGSLTMHIIVCH